MNFGTIGKGGDARLLRAGKHNLREMPVPAADPARSHMNVVLRGPGSAWEVRALAVRLREDMGIEPKRKDATIAAEILFSLPAGMAIDTSSYFAECVAWVEGAFGADGVFSAVVHYDEPNPHLHVLMLPVRHGIWRSSGVFGRKPEVHALQGDFFRQVASKYGLTRSPGGLTAADKRRVEADVLRAMRERDDAAMHSPLWLLLRARIAADPVPFAEMLGVAVAKCMRTTAEIFTSRGKGSLTPIGVEALATNDSYPV
jgi:hypothetical protein